MTKRKEEAPQTLIGLLGQAEDAPEVLGGKLATIEPGADTGPTERPEATPPNLFHRTRLRMILPPKAAEEAARILDERRGETFNSAFRQEEVQNVESAIVHLLLELASVRK